MQAVPTPFVFFVPGFCVYHVTLLTKIIERKVSETSPCDFYSRSGEKIITNLLKVVLGRIVNQANNLAFIINSH